jgi:hypothetical protein
MRHYVLVLQEGTEVKAADTYGSLDGALGRAQWWLGFELQHEKGKTYGEAVKVHGAATEAAEWVGEREGKQALIFRQLVPFP